MYYHFRIFGIPFLEDVDVKDEDISLHLLSNSINSKGTNQSNICKEDFRKVLSLARYWYKII